MLGTLKNLGLGFARSLGNKSVTTPILRKCEDEDSHSRNGNLGVHQNSQNFREQFQRSKHFALGNFLYHWKVLKCRCLKWARMTHLDICNINYGKKKGQKSNWQFDSRPQKVRNRPNPYACRWSATHRCKVLDDNYNFALDFIPIKGLNKKL
jgi:hypothetical protein